jgi:3-hydroxybutyryl-CoA dehydrogenase
MKILVVGAGIMGSGISQVLALNNHNVILGDVDESLLKTSIDAIKEGPYGLIRLVEKGKLKEDEVVKVLSRIKTSVDYSNNCEDVELVIEAVTENPQVKKNVFNKLDKMCPEKTIFVSNTSSILISELATSVKRKDRFAGMHWFNPAPIMPLIEVVKGPLTSEQTLSFIVELSKSLGKTPIIVNDSPGFYTTRFIIATLLEAIRMFEEGIAGIKEIDEMTKLGYRHPMGPFELMDLIGLDTVLHISEYLYENLGKEQFKPPITLKKLVLSGYLGDPKVKRGSKGGWYSFYIRS